MQPPRTVIRFTRAVLMLLLAAFVGGAATAQGSHGDDGTHAQQPHGVAGGDEGAERSHGAGNGAQGEGAQDHASHGDGEHGDGEHGVGEHDAHGHDYYSIPLMEMDPSDIFQSFYVHLMPHAVYAPEISPDPAVNQYLVFYDVNLYQVFAAVLIFLVFLPTLLSFGNPRPNVLLRVMRGWCLWIRDDVVYPVMGAKEGRRLLPGFLFVFFFIAFANLFGLVPNQVTANATIFVTGAMALITFVCMIGGGMFRQGPLAYWKNLIPHGVPAPMILLLFPLEVIGLLVKPFALSIRLFANMLAGHLVLYSFLGLILLFAQMVNQGAASYALAIPGVGLGVFIFIIEAFVALLQAYIFTLLSCIFIQQALHPDH
jgi:F-type H+-transporting ATPase subunit a